MKPNWILFIIAMLIGYIIGTIFSPLFKAKAFDTDDLDNKKPFIIRPHNDLETDGKTHLDDYEDKENPCPK